MKPLIITIAALGPDSGEMLTMGALRAMRHAGALVLRTRRHGAAALLEQEGIAFTTLDALYDACEDFDELCAAAAQALVQQARSVGRLCYAVSDPASDATVRALCRALPQDMALEVCGGVTLAACAACAVLPLGVDTENLRVMTALSAAQLRVQADCPQVITEVDSQLLASEVKLWLGDLFDDTTTVYFLENAAQPGVQARPIPLYALDRQAHYDHRTAVFVPRVCVYERSRASYEDVVEVIARLRGPDGCPWDREQTFHSLRRYMIEEACEAAEAMTGDDPLQIADELGDVLLQVVLNSAIGAEHRAFTDRDVTSMLVRKMLARHEHVFGGEKVSRADEVPAVWEKAKERERGRQTAAERVRSVPASLPSLMRAQKVIARQWKAQGGQHTQEEAVAALEQAVDALRGAQVGEAQLGNALEALCALACTVNLDAETALLDTLMCRIHRLEADDMA